MKYNYFKNCLYHSGKIGMVWIVMAVCIGISPQLFAQNAKQVQQIKSKTNVKNLEKLAAKYQAKHENEMKRARQLAKEKGWKMTEITEEGEVMQLVGLTASGQPLYYITDNVNAAATISTNRVHLNGGAGLNLDGTGLRMAQWDGGGIATNHPEITGRATLRQGSGISGHANHVAGTLIASGVNPSAKGMSPNGSLDAWDFNNDNAEMTPEAANGLLLSNHSYGAAMGWRGAKASGLAILQLVQ